jgi:endonuclease YncB( thermonuclease family)
VGAGEVKDKLPPIPPGFELEATGDVVDGDTIRLVGGLSGRLFGVDAFEKGQMGYRDDGQPVNLGDASANTLAAYLRPSQTVLATGDQTYGRPVVTMGSGTTDPVRQSILSGVALAAPEYLADDPNRRGRYMEDERLARINRQGAHQLEYMSPDAYRTAKRWGLHVRPDEEMMWSADVPELRPDLKRLTDDEEQDYYRFLAGKYGDPDFGQADLDAYWKGKGYPGSLTADPKVIEAVRKGERLGPVDYSSWDAQALRDFNMANGFAGLRPEVQQAYNAVLSDPSSSPESLMQFADVNGLTFDPRDVHAFYAARAKGENPNVPIPIINPGDGRSGAFGRGFADPFGFLDEMGGAVDAVAPEWMQRAVGGPTNRETVWNSDRGFGDIYENNTRQNRAIIDYDETHHPFMRAGGQLTSGFLLPYGGGIRGAANLAKVGAVEGGVYGFGSADGNLTQRLANVPLNATIGGAFGGALGKGAEVAEPFIARGMSRLGDFLPGSPQAIEATINAAPRAFDQAPPFHADELPPIPDGFALETPTMRANMDAEDAMPSISSPRIPDTIDVGTGRPTRMLDPLADQTRIANAESVNPSDVLPRPRNELTPEEAARLGEGPYQPVEAPRERDYLEAAEYPSRANPDATIARKGPADLVTFARTLNGIRDEGGELTAAGISNAVRKGEDFAGGENRLGKLVNPEGVGIEDAAERAWREGYFPELDRPPTNAEFVAALDDTYRGVGRRFRPEDEGQIQAFEGARDQRLAVERSRQEGAPLTQDLGQPATYADMVANTPPATAYDDWNNAVVSRVGNIDVTKLDTPNDIGQALKIADNIAGGFDAARRGQISHDETRALAQDLGMTADDLLARRKGQAFNAEEAYAARAILGKSANELGNMARRIQRAGADPGSETLAAFRKALLRHAAIQEQVAGATAEAGRALSAFRMAADSRDIPGRVLEEFVGGAGGGKRLKDAAEAILDFERDPANLNRFVEKVTKPRFRDKALELWINGLLSGPQTHAVNILSNTMTSLAQLPEHAVAAGVGAARRVLGGGNPVDQVTMREVGARAIGMMQGAKEGAREFARALRTGEARDFVSKVEDQGQKAISGLKGEVIRLPTRFLTAEDELFKGVARRMELRGLAMRQAQSEGLTGQALAKRAGELADNPTDDMMQAALDYGRYVTFQSPPGSIVAPISRFTQDNPAAKLILPFTRTPGNLFKFAVERSPAAPILKEWRRDFAAGGAKRDLAIARAMVGSGFGALFAEMAADGQVTGSPPSDENKRRLLYATGWRPYSVKIGDTYYSYQRLDPFALTIGAAADMATLGDGLTDSERQEGAGLIVASILGNMSDKTWLSGISSLIEALRDPQQNADDFVRRLVGSGVPTLAAQIARTADPTMRETPDMMGYIQSRIPGMSDNLLPRRDLWGQPIVSEGGVGPDIISPLWKSTANQDPVAAALLADDLKIGKLSRKVGGRNLTDQEYDRYQALAGPQIRNDVAALLASPDWQLLDQDGKQSALDKTAKASREIARSLMGAGKGKATTKGMPPIPPGFEAMPPVPEGFELVR